MLRPETSALPPDGLCDLLFYESFYKDDMNILADGYANLEPSARHFVDQAYHANKTLYGASFASTRPHSTPDLLTQEFYEAIDDLWVRKIHHYGFLNLYRETSAPEMVKDALLVLRELHFHNKLFEQQRRFSYEILGLYIDSINFPPVVDDTAFFISTVFVPSMFIAIGHLSFSDASFYDCTILPPNNAFFLPPNVTYVYDLVRTHWSNCKACSCCSYTQLKQMIKSHSCREHFWCRVSLTSGPCICWKRWSRETQEQHSKQILIHPNLKTQSNTQVTKTA
ncbi:uncharacterized protein [Dermacentor andersoni]|uniref:uncharacterized protein n=1 Tax=Dermacentor andersoni TaxID=34620 RepID=UPI002415D86D|nr:uncharacterized protein LOC129381909 [Dermacentor andersoni]